MFRSLFLVPFLLIPLAACTTTNVVTQQQFVVIEPPANLYNCPQVPLPDPASLTNKDLADLIKNLVKANKTCDVNMKSIQTYITKAKEIYTKRNNGSSQF